jgi:BolA protein
LSQELKNEMTSTPVLDQIRKKLIDGLNPQHLSIIDESEKHRGHSGAREGGESHFSVKIVSNQFEGLNPVARHRLINQILAEELSGKVHALSLKLLTPSELDRL